MAGRYVCILDIDFLEYINILFVKYLHLTENLTDSFSVLPLKNQYWRMERDEMENDLYLIKDLMDSYIKSIRVTLEGIYKDTNSSKFETKVPEKSQGSFKYVEQNNTWRATFRQLCREGFLLWDDVIRPSPIFSNMSVVLGNVPINLSEWMRVWYEKRNSGQVLLERFNCVTKSCTDLATFCQESITTIENFLSFTTEVLEAANMSNIGTRYLEKLLRLLRRTVQLKEQFEQLAKMRDECFSILGLPFIKERQEDVTDYPRYPDYLEHC